MKCNVCDNNMVSCEMELNGERISIVNTKDNRTYPGYIYVCEECGNIKLDLDMCVQGE